MIEFTRQKIAACLIIAFLLPLAWAEKGETKATLTGSVEYTFADYSVERGGDQVFEASHFSQDYAALYRLKGVLAGGRLGNYNLGLGYQWTAVNFEQNGESDSIDKGKIVYEGDLLIAPGGLPFRLHAYSRDLVSNETASSRSTYQGGESILEPPLVDDIDNGQHVTTGVTFIAGIRNGTYLGAYREFLSKYPRLLLDYREDYVRDVERLDPVHYRDRNLAFVSLNKKDNWFHYRVQQYRDFEDPSNDFDRKQYVLGTVDHNLRRQWIHLTNWINVSVDGSLTLTDDAEVEGEEIFDLNFFDVMRRPNFKMSNYNTFQRRRQENNLVREVSAPFYLEGRWSPDRDWRALVTFDSSKSTDDISMDDTSWTDFFVQGEVRFGLQEEVVYRPGLALAKRTGDLSSGEGAEAYLEVSSNAARRSQLNWLGRYDARWIDGVAGVDERNTAYTEQEALGRIEFMYSPTLRLGFEQRLLLGSGKYDEAPVPGISVKGPSGLIAAPQDPFDGTTFWSETTMDTEFLGQRAKNRMSTTYRFQADPDRTLQNLEFEHHLRNSQDKVDYTMTNRLIVGDNSPQYLTLSVDDVYLSLGRDTVNRDDVSSGVYFRHISSLYYRPARNYQASAAFEFEDVASNLYDGWAVKLRERVTYNHYSAGGFARKLWHLYQEGELLQVGGDITGNYAELTVGGGWHLTRSWWTSGEIRYLWNDGLSGRDELKYRISTGVDYSKLTAEVSYSYGILPAEDDFAEQVEHLVEARVRKTF